MAQQPQADSTGPSGKVFRIVLINKSADFVVCFSTLSVPVVSNGRMIPELGMVWKETVMVSWI
jgi:hypothetical protein